MMHFQKEDPFGPTLSRFDYHYGFCHEHHLTDIEERYCHKQHYKHLSDEDWNDLFSQEARLLYDIEEEILETPYLTETETASSGSVFSSPHFEELIERPVSPIYDFESDKEDEDYSPVATQKASTSISSPTVNRKRRRGKKTQFPARKRLCRSFSSSTSVTTLSSITSPADGPTTICPTSSSENPWKCPHCPWIQHTQRLPDFLRHQRSHFVTQSDWPCPNPKCGKGFARKDSLKRHLDNRATGCKRPPGYTVC